MNFVLRGGAAVSIGLATQLLGCAAETSDDDDASEETSEEALSSAAPAPGRYKIAGSTVLNGFWINDVTLRSDGTFNAVFGNNQGSVSGHRFSTHGRYEFHRFKVGPSLVFKFKPGAVAQVAEFTFTKQNDGSLKVRHLSSDIQQQTKFVLVRAH
jgi:hypothetical protein